MRRTDRFVTDRFVVVKPWTYLEGTLGQHCYAMGAVVGGQALGQPPDWALVQMDPSEHMQACPHCHCYFAAAHGQSAQHWIDQHLYGDMPTCWKVRETLASFACDTATVQ
ncbi:hypothetical protein [Luteitalea pratensis]|nr:hypothetical protein [Luteitalea pratensis]